MVDGGIMTISWYLYLDSDKKKQKKHKLCAIEYTVLLVVQHILCGIKTP